MGRKYSCALRVTQQSDVRTILRTNRNSKLFKMAASRVSVVVLSLAVLIGTAFATDVSASNRAKRGFPSPFGPVGPPPPSPALFNLPSFAAALASRSAASLVANKQASEANSAAQVALATAAHKQAKSALINKATQEAQDQAAAESALADEANKAAHAAEKTYARMVEVTKMLAKLASEAQASVSQAWEAMQSTKNVKSGQEAMTFKAQQTANMLARKQARTLNELDSAQDAVLQAKLAASKAAAAASGGLRGPY